MNEIAKNDYLTCLLNSLTAQSDNILSHESQQNERLSWLMQLRAEAIDQAGQLKLPTIKDEEWRFTDISPLAKLPYKPAKSHSALELHDIQPFLIEEANNRLVFIDGHFAPDLSNILDKDQLIIGNLSSLATSHATEIKHHLGQQVQSRNNIFTALNTAFLQDGALIVVPKNIAISKPIHLLFIATQKETTNYPRTLVVEKKTVKSVFWKIMLHYRITQQMTHISPIQLSNLILPPMLRLNISEFNAKIPMLFIWPTVLFLLIMPAGI